MKKLNRDSRIYIAGAYNEIDFKEAVEFLEASGWHVVNTWNTVDDLRLEFALLLGAGSLYLLEGWWTSQASNAVQHIATWLQMPIILTNDRVAAARA